MTPPDVKTSQQKLAFLRLVGGLLIEDWFQLYGCAPETNRANLANT